MGQTIDENIMIFTLDHGPTNSITQETLKALSESIEEVEKTERLLGLVLQGKGKLFSSGFDLPMFLDFKALDEVVSFFETEEQILSALFACKKPVVSAINGHCVAAGLIYSLAADYRVAANHPKIKIGMSEIKIGLPLSIAQTEVVRFGLDSDKRFRDIMFFGEMFSPESAREKGLVDETVDAGEVMPRAKQIINTWMNNPGRAFIPIKQSVRWRVIDRIQRRLQNKDWHNALGCFLDDEVRGALQFVQSQMG